MAEANLKLLGKQIKTFREQAQPKKLSQFKLSVLMHWEGTAPIVEIEQGRRLPRPETLNALGTALQLSPADIAYLHGLAGYREITVMPSLEQIKRVLLAIEPEIARRAYPVYVLDYRFQFWMMNGGVAVLEGGSLDNMAAVMRHRVDGLTMGFDSRFQLQSEDYYSLVALERDTIYRFKAYNLYRRHEPFYLAYPDCMRDKLLPQDYERFAQRWREVEVRMQDVYPVSPELVFPAGEESIKFGVHIVEIVHLDRLFFVAYYEPVEDGTGNRERCEAYFNQHALQDQRCIRAWDYWDDEMTSDG